MGTYDELMKLDQAKTAHAPKPKPPSPAEDVPSISQTKAAEEPHIERPLEGHKPFKATSRRRHDTTLPRHHDSMVSRYHATTIETIRAAVKQFGKEAATHRFTPEEKKAIADIVYTYKVAGTKTSENEIARIAINFLVADYQENGENSVLSQVLKALNS